MRHDLIRQVISHRAPDMDHARHIAAAVAEMLGQLYAELSLVVGSQAAAALCVHALHRTRMEMKWTMPASIDVSPITLEALRSDLAARSAANALYAGETLLISLVEHLMTLIGRSLTQRMLQSAWTAADKKTDFPGESQ